MISGLVSFEEIIESVKDETGITNLQSLYPRIRRFIYRTERDIGFGGTVLLKRVTYSLANGNLLKVGNQYKFKIPDDFLYVESFGMCQEGICPGDYRVQGNWIFLCKPVEKISFIYYTLICDGEGNPMVSENHFEAVIAGIVYGLYKPRRFQDRGGIQAYRDYEEFYHDRIREARGDDLMPSTAEEWSKISQIWKMSSAEAMIYLSDQRCFTCIDDDSSSTSSTDRVSIRYWQFDNIESNEYLPSIDQISELIPEGDAFSGRHYNMGSIGRIGFSIMESGPNDYSIRDIFDVDITDIVFNKQHIPQENKLVLISKNIYTYGSVYFKIVRNG